MVLPSSFRAPSRATRAKDLLHILRSIGSALTPEDPDGQIIKSRGGERLMHPSTEDFFDLLRKTLKAHDPTPRTGRPANSPVITPSRTVTTPFTTTMLIPVGY